MTIPVANQSTVQPYRPVDNHGKIALDYLTLFTFMWASQASIHQIAFLQWFNERDIVGIALTLVAVVLVFRSWSVWLFGLMLLLNVSYSLLHLPYQVNHLLYEDLVNVTLLAALLWTVYRQWRSKGDVWLRTPAARTQFFESFAPVLRVGLILLYFFATLAKINDDYLIPEVSCGATLMRDMLHTYRLSFMADWAIVNTTAVWGSLAVEGIMAVFLFVPSLRVAAIVIGLMFHFFLGLHPHPGIFSFTGLTYASLALFVGPGFVNQLSQQLEQIFTYLRIRENFVTWRNAILIIGGLFAAFLIALNLTFGPDLVISTWYRRAIWAVWAVAIIGLCLGVLYRTPTGQRTTTAPLFVNRGLLWLMPVLVIANAMHPYLGFKTQTSLAMFSNLRTENYSNHVFIPKSIQIGTYQNDLVDVLDTNHPEFQKYIEHDQYMVRFEFERYANEIEDDFEVTYQIYPDGETYTVTKTDGQLSSVEPMDTVYSWWAGRYFWFRPVSKGDNMQCTH